MTIRRRTQISVRIEWFPDRTQEGLTYAAIRWTDPDPKASPKRRKESLGYVTGAQAEDLRAAKEAALRLGLAPPSSSDSSTGYSVADLLVDYCGAVEVSPTTTAHKDRVADDCASLGRHLGRVQVAELTAHHVGRYLALRSRERGVKVRQRKHETDDAYQRRAEAARTSPTGKPISSTTIKAEIATLRRAMKWARDGGKTTAHPVPMPHRKALPKDRRPARRLTEAEVARIIAAAREHERTLLTVLAWSGRRPKAIFAARVKDAVRLLDERLPRKDRLMYWRTDKGEEATGWGPVTGPAYEAIRERARELLAEGAAPKALLWSSPSETAWKPSTWPKRFAKIAATSGVEDVTTYDLRKHACAQLLHRLGSARDAIRYSGHLTVAVFLDTYAYAMEGSAEDMAERITWTPAPLTALAGGLSETDPATDAATDRIDRAAMSPK